MKLQLPTGLLDAKIEGPHGVVDTLTTRLASCSHHFPYLKS